MIYAYRGLEWSSEQRFEASLEIWAGDSSQGQLRCNMNLRKKEVGEQDSRKCQDWKTIFLSQVFHTPIPSWLQTRPHCDQLVLKLNSAIYWQRRRLGRIVWEPEQGVSRCQIGFCESRATRTGEGEKKSSYWLSAHLTMWTMGRIYLKNILDYNKANRFEKKHGRFSIQ